MSQRIIIIHGRNIKPAEVEYKQQLKRALINGIERADPAKATKIKSGAIHLEFVYYGDINNRLLEKRAGIAKKLTAKDPDNGNQPCMPIASSKEGVDMLLTHKIFNLTLYKKILRKFIDQRWQDDAARFFSTISAFVSNGRLNEVVIKHATEDMGAYLLTRKTGSAVRVRLQEPLIKAFQSTDDICLISHSMGAIVAYDVLWKLSNMSEYKHVRALDPKVQLWLTIGCPLGEAGVHLNLYDAHERGEDRFPKHIIDKWVNIAARDDLVAHDATMSNDFSLMKKYGFLKSIKDHRIYNCFVRCEKSDPHNIYGYLAHQKTGQQLANWIT